MPMIIDLGSALPVTLDMVQAAMASHREYVDVRGVYPVYVNGQYAVELPNMPRDITVDQARIAAKHLAG